MDYDVLVLGGGIIGCAVAYELSKYNLNIAVIEKEFDIADDIVLDDIDINEKKIMVKQKETN